MKNENEKETETETETETEKAMSNQSVRISRKEMDVEDLKEGGK